MDRDQVREHLTGPIASIHTPFLRDGSIDLAGLRRMIDTVIANGSRTVLLTAGDSHYLCLGDDEIRTVTRETCAHTAGRAMVVAADRLHATTRAVEFARFAREAGADVVMCLPPDWGPSCTPQTLADHYRAVSVELPVMMVTGLFLARDAAFGLETIARALDTCPQIVAVKDDFCGDFARRLGLLAHERTAVFAGGQKANHLSMWPYGCDGYLSTFIHFGAEIPGRYWSAIQAADIGAAAAVIADYDAPFFEYVSTLTGGWNAGLHGALELFGVAGRWRRPPYYSLDDAQMEQLAGFFRERHLLS